VIELPALEEHRPDDVRQRGRRDRADHEVDGLGVDEDDEAVAVDPLPGLSAAEVRALEERLGNALPPDVRDLVTYAGGFDYGPVDRVDFRGELEFELEGAFPHGLPLCGDGYGNFWVVDVTDDGAWDSVFYASPDPPVLVYQASSLAAFLDDLFDMCRPDGKGHVDLVHDEAAARIWRDDPWARRASELDGTTDPALAAFLRTSNPDALVCDLRERTMGSGFAWGRFGPTTPVKRDADRLLFAVEPPPPKRSWLDRLLGRS
jgi:hypothetical protein